MSHPTFRNTLSRLFLALAVLLAGLGLARPAGSALASHVQPYNPESCALGFTEFCLHDSGGGSTTSSSTSGRADREPRVFEDTDGDGRDNNNDPCPRDANGVRDQNGNCPSDENGQRNSSPGSLQGFQQRGTGIQQLYTNDGRHILDIPVDLVRTYANYPPGATIPLQTTDGQTLTLTNQGNGSFTGQYNGGDFNFTRSDDLTVRPTVNTTGQSNSSSPGVLRGVIQNGTGWQQLYSSTGQLIASVPPSLLNFYGHPGEEFVLPGTDGRPLLMTYQGDGNFTGRYNGQDFNFSRPDAVNMPPYSHDYIHDDPDAPIPSHFINNEHGSMEEIRILNENGEPIYVPRDIPYGRGPGQRSDLSDAIAQAILGPSATEEEIQELANHGILVIDMQAPRQLQAVNRIRNNPDREEAARLLAEHQAAVAQLQQRYQQLEQMVDSRLEPVYARLRELPVGGNYAEERALRDERDAALGMLANARDIITRLDSFGISPGDASRLMQRFIDRERQVQCSPDALARAEARVAALMSGVDGLRSLLGQTEAGLAQARDNLGREQLALLAAQALGLPFETRTADFLSARVAMAEAQRDEAMSRVVAATTELHDAQRVYGSLRVACTPS
ncbi:MAG: hypothetical protein HY023_08985 [Chloroflexi bacterium]|nr:hypothetical protein [Chloroflexota bacterium]